LFPGGDNSEMPTLPAKNTTQSSIHTSIHHPSPPMPMIFKSLPNQRPPGIQLPIKKAQGKAFPFPSLPFPSPLPHTRQGKKRRRGKRNQPLSETLRGTGQRHNHTHTHTMFPHCGWKKKGLPTFHVCFLSRFQFLPLPESLHKFSCVFFIYTHPHIIVSSSFGIDGDDVREGGKTGA